MSPLIAAFIISLYAIVSDSGISNAAPIIEYARIGGNLELTCRLPLDKYNNSSAKWTRNSAALIHSAITSDTQERNFTTFIGTGTTIKLTNVQRNNSGIYKCTIGGRKDHFEKEITVLVGTSPDKPSNLSCTTDHSLSFMTCCWDVGRHPGITSRFSLNYFSRKKSAFSLLFGEDEYREGRTGNCNVTINNSFTNFLYHMPRHCCQIDVDFPTIREGVITEFIMQLSSANALGVNISSNSTEKPQAWIQPSSPFDLRMNIFNSSRGYVVRTWWKKPNMTIDEFEYRIRYRIVGGEIWQVHDKVMKNEYQFDMIRSHSVFEIQVAARPINGYSGYWSDWSETAYNSTGISKPCTRMKYESIMCDVTNNTLSLDIKWLPYIRQDEPVFRNKIMLDSCSENAILVNASTKDLAIHFTLNFTDCIVILGSYCNSQGCSLETSKIIRPQYAPKFKVKNLCLQLNDSGFSVTWSSENLPKNRKCLVSILEMQRSYRDCLLESSKIFERMEVNCNSNHSFLAVAPSPCFSYVAKVSTMNSSNDVVYIRTAETGCISISDPSIPAFDNLRVEDISTDEARFFVEWSNEISRNCSNLQPRILYQPVKNQKCQSNNSALCNQIMISRPLECEASSSTQVLVNLTYDWYNVEAVMCCRNKLHQELPKCFSPNHRIVASVHVHNLEHIHRISVGVLVGALLGIVFIISAASLIYYRKKYIKDVLLKMIWPEVPRPVIYVELQENATHSVGQGAALNGTGLNESSVTSSHCSRDYCSQTSLNGEATVEEYDDLQLPLIQSNTSEANVGNSPKENQQQERTNIFYSDGCPDGRNLLFDYATYKPSPPPQGLCSTPVMDEKSEEDRGEPSQVCYTFLACRYPESIQLRPAQTFGNQNTGNKSLKYYSLEHQPTSKFCGSMPSIPSYLSYCEHSYDASTSTARRFSDQSLLPNYTSTLIPYSEDPGVVGHLQMGTQYAELPTSLSHLQDTDDSTIVAKINDLEDHEIEDNSIATDERCLFEDFTTEKL